MCLQMFANMLQTKLGQLPLKVPLAEGYDPNAKLIELIECPKWCGTDFEHKAKDTLIPDLITIDQLDGQNCFIIFDAKYYLLQLEKGRSLRGYPGIGDVTKQYLYQLAYKQFITDHQISIIRNCFLMPTESDGVIIQGTAKLEMLSNLGLEHIQIRKIPATELFQYYLSRKRLPLEKLQLI